jgi:hypothetical protein
MGLPDLAMVITPHPLNNQPEQMVRDVARERVGTIVTALTDQPA